MHSIVIPSPVRHALFVADDSDHPSILPNCASIDIYGRKGRGRQPRGSFKLFRKKPTQKSTVEICEEEPQAVQDNDARKKYVLSKSTLGGNKNSSQQKMQEQGQMAYPYFDPNLAPLLYTQDCPHQGSAGLQEERVRVRVKPVHSSELKMRIVQPKVARNIQMIDEEEPENQEFNFYEKVESQPGDVFTIIKKSTLKLNKIREKKNVSKPASPLSAETKIGDIMTLSDIKIEERAEETPKKRRRKMKVEKKRQGSETTEVADHEDKIKEAVQVKQEDALGMQALKKRLHLVQ